MPRAMRGHLRSMRFIVNSHQIRGHVQNAAGLQTFRERCNAAAAALDGGVHVCDTVHTLRSRTHLVVSDAPELRVHNLKLDGTI